MTFDRNTLCTLGAALILAGAGILGVIDTTSMIVLVLALTTLSGRRGTCSLRMA